MLKYPVLKYIVTFVVVLMIASAVGYLFFPAQMLTVVGIEADATRIFFARVIGIGLISFAPAMWAARGATSSPVARYVLGGMGLYLLLSSANDLYAYTQAVVNASAVPSIILRTVLVNPGRNK